MIRKIYTYIYIEIVCLIYILFFFKQKTAYEMRISDWSSDVCSSDRELVQNVLGLDLVGLLTGPMPTQPLGWFQEPIQSADDLRNLKYRTVGLSADLNNQMGVAVTIMGGGEIVPAIDRGLLDAAERSEERRVGKECVSRCRYRWSP